MLVCPLASPSLLCSLPLRRTSLTSFRSLSPCTLSSPSRFFNIPSRLTSNTSNDTVSSPTRTANPLLHTAAGAAGLRPCSHRGCLLVWHGTGTTCIIDVPWAGTHPTIHPFNLSSTVHFTTSALRRDCICHHPCVRLLCLDTSIDPVGPSHPPGSFVQ